MIRCWSSVPTCRISRTMSWRADHQRTAAAIEACDEAAIGGSSDACGHLAVRGALIQASRRGLAIEQLALRNSRDGTGDRRSVVGYGAWAFYARR